MDCEKFEPLLLDELYEELDELTSAAVKRHVSGCARCAGILNGFKSTRRAIALPLVPVPEGLEDRIFAAAREAQKVVPIRGRMSRVLSVAGNWAMRPQTAMAAVFLLMIGTSAFLIRSKNYASKESTVSVTVQGEPAPQPAPVAQSESLDDKAAAAAHGPSTPNVTAPPAAPAASAVAMMDDNGPVDRLTAGAARDKAKEDGDLAGLASLGDTKDSQQAQGRFAPPPPAPTPAPVATTAPIANAGPLAGAPGGGGSLGQGATGSNDPYGYSQQPAKPSTTKRSGPKGEAQDPFSLGAAAFRARNFAEAARQFDVAAQSGDTNAALWAAESTREGQGCAVALGRFDSLAQRASGSWVGHEASLRAARCQIAMGQLDPARERLNKLTQVASHASEAQNALTELNAIAARKAGGTGGAAGAGAAAAAPKRAASPAARPAPARAPAQESEQKKQVDKVDHGF